MPGLFSGCCCSCDPAIKRVNVAVYWEGFGPFLQEVLAPPVRVIFGLYKTLTFTHRLRYFGDTGGGTSGWIERVGSTVFTYDPRTRGISAVHSGDPYRILLAGDLVAPESAAFFPDGVITPVTTANPEAEEHVAFDNGATNWVRGNYYWSKTHLRSDWEDWTGAGGHADMTLSNELTIDDVETELHDILALPAADFDDEDFTYPPNGYMRLRSFRWIRDWVSLGVELTEDEAAFYAGMIERNQIGPLLGPAWIDGYYRVVFPGDWESWTNDSITARLIWAETVVSSGNPINALMSFDQLAYTDLANANQFSRQHIRSRLRESDPDSARNYCLVRLLAGFYDDTGASYSSTTRSGFSLIRPDEHDFLGLLIAPETSPSPRLITATETIYRDHQVSGGGSACVEDEVIPEC